MTINSLIPELRGHLYSFLNNSDLVLLSVVNKIFYKDLTNDVFFKNKFLKDHPTLKNIANIFFKEGNEFHPTFFWKACCLVYNTDKKLTLSFFQSALPGIEKGLIEHLDKHKSEKETPQISLAEESYAASVDKFLQLQREYGDPYIIDMDQFEDQMKELFGSDFDEFLSKRIEEAESEGISAFETLNEIDKRCIPFLEYHNAIINKRKCESEKSKELAYNQTSEVILNNLKYLKEDAKVIEVKYSEFFNLSIKQMEITEKDFNVFFNDFEELQKLFNSIDVKNQNSGQIIELVSNKLTLCGEITRKIFENADSIKNIDFSIEDDFKNATPEDISIRIKEYFLDKMQLFKEIISEQINEVEAEPRNEISFIYSLIHPESNSKISYEW